ncbi:MAG: LysM peptidoglycan-binding domain-containing protein [Actinomycetota bacterium]
MNNIRALFVVALALLLSGCGLFGGDDTATTTTADDLSANEDFVAPTANVVQQIPLDEGEDGDAMADETDGAPLPTAVTIPATPVPPEPTPDRSQPTTYVVQSGDVLGLIAERFDVDIAELRRVNNLSGNLIQVGQTLTIPAADGSTDTSSGTVTSTEPADDETASSSSTPAATPTPVSCGAGAVGHCVQSGDSLLGIASQYGTTVDELRAANPGIVGDQINIGDLLTIPGQTTAPPSTDTGSSGGTTGGTPVPTGLPAPTSDADCAARNPEFPFFHAADGLCYANPIGGTPVPTAQGADPDAVCEEGKFLWEDGLCYPIPGVTPTPANTPTPGPVVEDFFGLIADGCDPWEIEWPSRGDGECWPSADATADQIEQGRATRPT